MILPRIVSLFCFFALIAPVGLAGDWPMWRCDASRSAASPEDLPGELHLQWVRQYPPREPVWDDPLNWDLMPYDTFFEPVVAGDTLFVGFNDADKLAALDTGTGKEKWAFYTDGPVRLPPVAWQGKVYFGSDDGCLYCLNGKNGKLLWRRHGGPDGRKVLGNKRVISMWPVRGGPVIADGVLYFAASIWPMMGTFMYALDPETGETIWLNDADSATFQQQPHGGALSFAGVGPQGAFVVAGDKLLVPGGRSVPAALDRATGDLLYYRLGSSGKTGGAFVCAGEGAFFNHHREKVTTLYDLDTGDILVRSIGTQPVVSDGLYYFSGSTVSAYDAAQVRADPKDWEAARRWELDVDASGDLIRAGGRLYAAGNQRITAIELSEAGDTPQIAWAKTVEGDIKRLVAADGKLFAVTEDGRIMAFGPRRQRVRQAMDRPVPAGPAPDGMREALDILEQTGASAGYALYFGRGDADLLEALVSGSDLCVIAVVPEGAPIGDLREHFDGKGIYGRRLAIHQGDPLTFEAPPYIASLTIVDYADTPAAMDDETLLARVFHSMRPYGGAAWLRNLSPEDFASAAGAARSGDFPGLDVESEGLDLIMFRKGPLPGAANWTHLLGNPAQTGKSDDTLVRLPLGLLWFGGPSNLDVLPRHGHGPTEQVVDGRLFIEGMDCLSARDVYTGRVLWKTPLYGLDTFDTYFNKTYKDAPTVPIYNQVHIPGANIRGTNFVATQDAIYVIQGGTCAVLDPATGEITGNISLPFEDPEARRPKPPPWGYIGVYDDLLIAGAGFVAFSDILPTKKKEYSIWEDFDRSASHRLLGMNRRSGEILWQIDARHGFLHNGTAIGGGTLFCLDKLPPHIEGQLARRGAKPPSDYRLLAVDVRTGRVIWEETDTVFGSFLCYSEEYDTLLQTTRPSRDQVRGETGERMVAYRGSDGAVLWDESREYPTFPLLHGRTIVTEGGMFDLLTGKVVERQHPLTGKILPWTWSRKYGCNYPIAAEYVLTFRSGAAGYYDMGSGGGTGNFGGFKSGCSACLVAANGVLNAPDYTRTCSCAYQNQTSLALVHMPDAEAWTFNEYEAGDDPIKRVGINLGAPGDRLTPEGTLWLDYPSVGGPSPDIPVSVTPERPEWFRHHSLRLDDEGLRWVAASGGKGIESVRVKLMEKAAEARPYTVRLHFVEPEPIGPHQRVFGVSVQGGQALLERLDIVQEAGAPMRPLVKDFQGIQVRDVLTVELRNADPETVRPPIICGIEAVAEGW